MSCCSESGLLPIDSAIEKLIGSITPQHHPAIETISINDALGRVLAEPICSSVNVPPHDNSAMDGYALCFSDLSPQGRSLPVSQRIPAGVDPEPLKPGTAARIFTGAPVPKGADTVVMQEDCELQGDQVTVAEGAKSGSHIRRAGEDIEQGQTVLTKGRRLTPQDIGLIASVGVARVSVFKPLRIALLFSGDELLEPGETPVPGKIFNSNRYMLMPMMAQLGFSVSYQANIPDTYDETVSALRTAAAQADVIVTTGGVSVGEEDHLKPAVEAMGVLDLWKVNIKPGKPFAFGSVAAEGGAMVPFIGLPGNPVSVFTTLLVLGLPYLKKLQGEHWQPPIATSVAARFAVKKAGKRDEYIRVRLVKDGNITYLDKYPNQSSGVLSSASWCDGFALVRAGDLYERGEHVPYISLSQFLG